mmetsp:Transcript_12504/g.29512  ORF Transcript_12504/g.29512 Transcript_12504/m.29512 type:complete len:135 (+) Transcript_12504:30-434(+)
MAVRPLDAGGLARREQVHRFPIPIRDMLSVLDLPRPPAARSSLTRSSLVQMTQPKKSTEHVAAPDKWLQIFLLSLDSWLTGASVSPPNSFSADLQKNKTPKITQPRRRLKPFQIENKLLLPSETTKTPKKKTTT